MSLDEENKEYVRLIASSERRLAGYILTLVPNYYDADEILQETHVKLWEERSRYEHGTNFHAWAMRIAHYQVMTWRKKCERNRLTFNDDLLNEINAHAEAVSENSSERHEALLTCLSELSEKSRKLMAKVYADGMKIKEVATSMGRTPESLYKVVQRLRITLRNCIEQRLSENEG